MVVRSTRACAIVLACVAAILLGCRRRHVRAQPVPSVAETLRDRALSTGRAVDHVRSLTDEVGPRLAGSEGDAHAVAWGLARMKALGFARVRAEKVRVTHWVRGEERGEITTPFPHTLALTALGGTVATPPEGVIAEVVEVASLEALAALPDEAVRGKIVFFDKPMERTRDGSGYGRAVEIRTRGPFRAAKKGAVAVVIRSVSTADTRLPHTGSTRTTLGDDKATIPAAALAVPDAMLLHRLLSSPRGGEVRVRLTLACRTEQEIESANVIGEVVGRERPDEVVLLGAHLDSWDLGTGAIDDGAGVAIVLEAGRLITEQSGRPRRTLRVVLFASEENGLRGARAYVREHEKELEKHVVAMELDLGTGRAWDFTWLAGAGAEEAMRAVTAPFAPLGIEAAHPSEYAGASDVRILGPYGVPLASFQQDASKYFDIHHSADDTFDKIDAKALDQVTAATVAFAWGAADLVGDFGRIPPEKRPVR